MTSTVSTSASSSTLTHRRSSSSSARLTSTAPLTSTLPRGRNRVFPELSPHDFSFELAEPPEPQQLDTEVDERVARFIEDHTWPLRNFCNDMSVTPSEIPDYFLITEDDVPHVDCLRLYDTVLDLSPLEKPEARSAVVARLYDQLHPSDSQDPPDTRQTGTKSPGPPLASSPKRNRFDDLSTIVLDDDVGGGDGGDDADGGGDGDGDGDDDDNDEETDPKDGEDDDDSPPVDESDVKAVRKALHILLARSDHLKLVDEKATYHVYRQDSVKDPAKLKGCLPLHRQFLSNYYAAEKELLKPKFVRRGTPIVMDAVKKCARLYPMSQASIPSEETDKDGHKLPDIEVGFMAKDRVLPQRLESITSFKTRAQLEKTVTGATSLSASTMSTCSKLVRAASAAANYGNYFTFAAKKMSMESHSTAKTARALLDREPRPSRCVERAKEKLDSLLDSTTQEYTLLKAAGMTNEDTFSALTALDTNFVLTQRDKVLDKLSAPLDYAKQPLRTDSLVSDSFFPSAPKVIEHSREDLMQHNSAQLVEHIAKQTFRGNKSNNKSNRGASNSFRGKPKGGSFQGNQFGNQSGGFGRGRGGFRGSRGSAPRGRGKSFRGASSDKK